MSDQGVSSIANLAIRSILNLPFETVLEFVSYLDRQDILALRSTCKYMDTILLDTFAKQFFSQIYVLPTEHSLQLLLEVSNDKRIRRHVKELLICCTIYQDHSSRYGDWESDAHIIIHKTRLLTENESPFPDTTSPEEEATNEAVNFVRKGSFGRQLTAALQSLEIDSIEILNYGQMKCWHLPLPLILGRSQLLRRTGRDPFDTPDCVRGRGPRSWEYASNEEDGPMDMATYMSNTVLSAIEDSGLLLRSFVIPVVQTDRLKALPTLSSNLSSLQHLKLTIGHDARSTCHDSPDPDPNFFTSINELPNLQHLHLSTWPARARPGSVSLNPFLSLLKPLNLRSLHLGSLCAPSQDLVPLLVPLKTFKHFRYISSLCKKERMGLGEICSRTSFQ
ncbi:unnamed protein product [Aureobasidium mustum]|uniref:F-box domain-containing protein n=1 Tax=Aureobasidium mustum TaxID=2773714 RepID=A0A9N8PJF7_9PEZI|nr:unnamed protein product [Aureobasidium mustum]